MIMSDAKTLLTNNIDLLIIRLKDISKLFLVVGDFNLRAKKLYKKIGYSEIGDIPNLYKYGITKCVMIKSRK